MARIPPIDWVPREGWEETPEPGLPRATEAMPAPGIGQHSMTLFVDASHCPHTFASGWGAWAKSSRYSRGYVFGGPAPVAAKDSSHAELIGIAEAARILHEHDEFKGLQYVLVQCDNLNALQLMLKFIPSASKAKRKNEGSEIVYLHYLKIPEHMAPQILALQEAFRGVSLYLRHVKGHAKGIHSRSWVNERCDGIARKHMQEERARYVESGIGGDLPWKLHRSGNKPRKAEPWVRLISLLTRSRPPCWHGLMATIAAGKASFAR